MGRERGAALVAAALIANQFAFADANVIKMTGRSDTPQLEWSRLTTYAAEIGHMADFPIDGFLSPNDEHIGVRVVVARSPDDDVQPH